MKRRTLAAAAAIVALTLTTATVATAQRGQGGGGGRFGQGRGGMFGGGGLQMLRIPQVQVELKMTEAQIAKLDAKQDEVQNGMRELFQSLGDPQAFRDMSPEDRAKFQAKVAGIQDKAVADVLDATQLVRYKQLVLQREGPAAAAARKEVADALKLTEVQRKQIGEIQRTLNETRMQSFQSLGRDATPEDRQKAMTKLQADQDKANEQVLALFNEDQKKAWKEMTGAPFKFPAPGQRAA